MINFDYTRPSTAALAVSSIAKDKTARFIAGGTNLVDLMKRGVMQPQKVIDINALPLRQIEERSGTIHLGALALNSTVAEHSLVMKSAPLLTQALEAGASPQIRNMATIGGNLMQRTRCPYFYDTTLPCNKREPGTGCSALKGYNRMHAIFGGNDQCIAVNPSDMNVALTALDAVVVVQGPKAVRRIPIQNFHRLPGTTPHIDNNLQREELITGVQIPFSSYGSKSLYTKIRDRASYAFALVSVAAVMQMDGAKIRDVKIAMGGVAHKPWRLTATEYALRGQVPTEALLVSAIAAGMQDARGYGHNDFKKPLGSNTLLQSLKTLSGLA